MTCQIFTPIVVPYNRFKSVFRVTNHAALLAVTITDDETPSITCPADLTVQVDTNCEFVFPSIQGDHIVENYSDNGLSVYSRWGNPVFEMEDYDSSWSGNAEIGLKLGRNSLPERMYFFLLELGEDIKPVKGYICLNKYHPIL